MGNGARDKKEPGAPREARRTVALRVPGEITATSLRLPAGMAYADWQGVGRALQQIERSVQWWIGDWLNYGERTYGEKYSQAVEETGIDKGQLANYAWVASNVDRSLRNEALSWSHHRMVADLEPDQQREWLQKAQNENLPANALRAMIKGEGPPKKRVFGRPLNFRELRHEPIDEQGVVFLFGMVAHELGFLVESVRVAFPDCRAKRLAKDGRYVEHNIELEFKSSNFREHGHDPSQCDLIVCWEHDWLDCPLEVLELKSAIAELDPNV